jgi:phosphate transport system substrate-binding protein
VTREVGSGTRADFEEIILGNNPYAHNVVVAASTYEVSQTVAVSPNDLGYVARNALGSQFKLLNVNNISLNQLNVENGSYPLKRSMLFLLKGTPTGTVKDFIDFSLSPEGQSIVNNVENGSTSNNTTTQNPGIGPAGG